jgi:hypothetical protein
MPDDLEYLQSSLGRLYKNQYFLWLTKITMSILLLEWLTTLNEIDRMHSLRNTTESNEQKRLASVAITEMQGAQMWAVKALTWKD